MKYNLPLITLSTLVFFICSCKKGGSDSPDANTSSIEKVKLLTSLTYTTTDYPSKTIPVNTYSYDDKHRLIEVNSNNVSYEKLTYDNNDRVIQTDVYAYGFLESTDKYTYQTGSIQGTHVSYLNGVAGTSYSNLLTLDNNQRVIKTGSNDSFVYDNQGNILSQSSGSIVEYSFTYDNNKNPFVNVKGNSFFFLNQGSVAFGNVNNILTVSVPGDPNPAIHSYTFDLDGYPITESTILYYNGPTAIIRTYKYTYSLL